MSAALAGANFDPAQVLVHLDEFARSPGVGAVDMRPGAQLLLFTDGLFERRTASIDDALSGVVADFAAHRDAPIGTLLDALVADDVGGDDVCLLCLQYTPGS